MQCSKHHPKNFIHNSAIVNGAFECKYFIMTMHVRNKTKATHNL